LLYWFLGSVQATTGCMDEELERLIWDGRISEARWTALRYLRRTPTLFCQKQIAGVFVEAYNQALSSSQNSQIFMKKIQEEMNEDDVSRFHQEHQADEPDCIPVPMPLPKDQSFPSYTTKGKIVSSVYQWDECCSLLPTIIQSDVELIEPLWETRFGKKDDDVVVVESKCPVVNPCCNLFIGSLSYLRLPMLQEPAVSVKIRFGIEGINGRDIEKTFYFEQDGYLRSFDPAAVLWPTGYLLAQCIANPTKCGIEDEFHLAWSDYLMANISGPFAMELGAGLGAPSMALSEFLHLKRHTDGATTGSVTSAATSARSLVVAADISSHALATILTNARINDSNVQVLSLNHSGVQEVKTVFNERYPRSRGYSLIMGSSLQSFFENPRDPSSILWRVLDVLLSRTLPNALVILVSGRSTLAAPWDGSFQLIHRISGDQLNMQTLWGDSSDFEIFVFRRGRQQSEWEL